MSRHPTPDQDAALVALRARLGGDAIRTREHRRSWDDEDDPPFATERSFGVELPFGRCVCRTRDGGIELLCMTFDRDHAIRLGPGEAVRLRGLGWRVTAGYVDGQWSAGDVDGVAAAVDGLRGLAGDVLVPADLPPELAWPDMAFATLVLFADAILRVEHDAIVTRALGEEHEFASIPPGAPLRRLFAWWQERPPRLRSLADWTATRERTPPSSPGATRR